MVVSINPNPEKKEFQALLDRTLTALELESKNRQNFFLDLLGRKFENVVIEMMEEEAKGTPFENSLELISGQKFPDIVVHNYYGVEVKTTKQNHWTTTGNSILEGTRVDGVERIYIMFGKMVEPVEFKYRPYEDCLSDVVITHSPRYLINMNLDEGETIFDKLKIDYDSLRNLKNPVKPIIDYYRKLLKSGEEVWWLDQESEKPASLIIRLWNNLSREERNDFMLKAMILFPEIFSNHPDKFNRFAIWMVNINGIVCPNVRDIFTAGGQGSVSWNGKDYTGIPRLITKLTGSLDELITLLNQFEEQQLSNYWKTEIVDACSQWIDLVIKNTSHMKLALNFKEYLNHFLLD